MELRDAVERLNDAYLFALVAHPPTFMEAWKKIWRNGGIASGDRGTLEHFPHPSWHVYRNGRRIWVRGY